MISGLVSVIIPVHNRIEFLREAVDSVLAQTYRPVEIIIVDDGSTEGSLQMVDAIAQKHPNEISIIHQSNKGAGLAREAGRLLARGEFIQYLDSDDLLLPEKFELQVRGLRDNDDCDVSYGYTRYRYQDGSVEPRPWKGSGQKVETMFPSFLVSRWWDTLTPLYRKEICDRAGSWADLRLEEDWEYDCRIASLGVKLHFCREYIAEVRDHSIGRLCKGKVLDPIRLRERAKAHALIFEDAKRGGIDETFPEMQHFARELFLLSRQCGSAGLIEESQLLFELSKKASGGLRSKGLDFKIYKLLSDVFGWKLTGRYSCWRDRLRELAK